MKRFFRKGNIATLAIACIIGTSACEEKQDDRPEDVPSDTYTDYFRYQDVISNLFDTEDVSFDSPKVGLNWDQAQPTVFYRTANTISEAIDFFNMLCDSTMLVPSSSKYSSKTYYIGDYGTLIFHPIVDGETLAAIDIHLKDVPSITQIRIVIPPLWPVNEESPFHLGDLVKDDTNPWIWMCVQELNSGQPALFITFDGTKVTTSQQAFSNIQRISASAEALRAWYNLMYSESDFFENQDSQLKELSPRMYEAAEYISGCKDIENLYYAVGSRVYQYYRYIHIPNAKYTVMHFRENDTPEIPIGYPLTFYCWGESTSSEVTSTLNCFSLKHSGTISFEGLNYSVNNLYINMETASYSFYSADKMNNLKLVTAAQ
jgi:hypothetical protein